MNIMQRAAALGLYHFHARFTGEPNWQHRDVGAVLVGAEDISEAARHFAAEIRAQAHDKQDLADRLEQLAEEHDAT